MATDRNNAWSSSIDRLRFAAGVPSGLAGMNIYVARTAGTVT